MSSAAVDSRGTEPYFLKMIKDKLKMTFETAQEEVLHKLDECMPTSVVDSYTSSKRIRKVCLGDLRVSAIRKLLETGFGVTRSTMQAEFHEAFLAATSRHLYSEDSNVNWAEVKARQGWADTRAVGESFLFLRSFSFAASHIIALLSSFSSPLSNAQTLRQNGKSVFFHRIFSLHVLTFV